MALTINSLGRFQFSINDGAGASVFDKEFEVIARGASDAAIRNANDGHLIRIPLGSSVGGTVPASQGALIKALVRAVSGAPQAAPRWSDATGTALVGPTGETVPIGVVQKAEAWKWSLFADGGVGAWWDNQDLSTLYEDLGGVRPAVVNGLVGYQRDKSGNGRDRSAASDGVRPTLRRRSDGVYYLDYIGGKALQVPASAALFKFLHDGTGFQMLAGIKWPAAGVARRYMSTATSTSQVGIDITKDAANESVTVNIYFGTPGNVVAAASTLHAFNSGQYRMIALAYKNDATASDMLLAYDSARTTFPGVTGNTPSTADSTSSLSISTGFEGYEFECIVLAKKLSTRKVQDAWAHFKLYDDPVPSAVDYTLIIGGQSNASGRGAIQTGAESPQVTAGVYSYTKAEEFRLAAIPDHSTYNRPTATSPDEPLPTSPQYALGFPTAININAATGRSVLLVPCAVGSTSISQWDVVADIADRTKLLGAMNFRYDQAAAKAGGPVYLWYGHENDASLAVPNYTAGGVGTGYQSAWNALVATLRANVVDAPMIMVQLSSDDDLAQSVSLAGAGEAQRQIELSASRTYMVVSHDVQRNASTDDIHVSRIGHDVIAARAALAFREHILGEAIDGTGPRIVSATRAGAVITLTLDREVNTTAGNYGNLFRVYDNNVEGTVSSAVRAANTSQITITCSATLTGPVTLTYGYRAGAASAARTDFVKGTTADALPLPLFGPLLVTV